MNATSQWRFRIAERIALFYAENPSVAAAMVSGSTARGHADCYSDTEIGVFWHRAPTETERKRVYHVEPSDGAHLLTALVEETYNLIETYLPEVDIAWLRHVFRYQRPALDRAPVTDFAKRSSK